MPCQHCVTGPHVEQEENAGGLVEFGRGFSNTANERPHRMNSVLRLSIN